MAGDQLASASAETRAGVHTAIGDLLDPVLPADPYPKPMFDQKVELAIFNHIVASYAGEGVSVYNGGAAAPSPRWHCHLGTR